MPSKYSNEILADSPIAYYRSGESIGSTAYDSSGNARDATINGGVTKGIKGAITKDLDTAMLFDGSSGYIDVPASVVQGSTVTVECWFKLTSNTFSNYPRPIANDNVGSSLKGVELGIIQFGQGVFVNFGYTSGVLGPGYGTNLLLGVWYHLVATYGSATALLYLNGQQVATQGSGGTLAAGTFAYDIGRNPAYSGDYFPGGIDEVAFYSTALSPARILAHYNAGIASAISSSQDTFFNKYQIVKCYDPNMLFIDIIRDAPLLQCKENINAAADTVKMTLPRPIDAFDGAGQPGSKNTIVAGNIVQWWLYGPSLPSTGLLKFQGKIDAIGPKLENGAESVEVAVTPFSQILGDHGVGNTAVTYGTPGSSSTYIDTGTIFWSFFTGSYVDRVGNVVSVLDPITGKPYGDPFTMDPTSLVTTGQFAQFAFQSQKLIAMCNDDLNLSTVLYFFRMNQDKTVYFHRIPTDPTHTLLLGQHISDITYDMDNTPRKNVIHVIGAGSVKATATGSSVSSLGQRVHYIKDDRLTDQNTANLIAAGWLSILDRETVRAKVTVPDYRGSAQQGLGYDIEAFKVGQTVKILDARAPSTSIVGSGAKWGSAVWGTDKWGAPTTQAIWGTSLWGQAAWSASVGSIFTVVAPIMSVQYDFHSVTLELGIRQPSLSRALFDLELRVQEAVNV